jgi:hypothetical protein
MKLTAKLTLLTVLALASTLATFSSPAQATNKSSEKKLSPASKHEVSGTNSVSKQTAGPFHGKLAALDKSARTVTIGKRTFHVTSDTKIMKAGKPATFEEGVVGEESSGYFKASDDGKLVASKLTFGPKVDGKSSADKKSK